MKKYIDKDNWIYEQQIDELSVRLATVEHDLKESRRREALLSALLELVGKTHTETYKVNTGNKGSRGFQ